MSLQTAYADFQAGNFEAAETKLAALLMREPGNAQALHLAAMVAQRRGDLQAALNRIQESLKSSDNAHEKLNTRGLILRAMGADVDSLLSFEAAAKFRPNYVPARINHARTLLETSQPVEAAEAFRALIPLSDEPAMHRGLVHALIESNQLDAAEAALEASPLEPADASAFRARLAFYRGEYETAVGEAAKATNREANGPGPFSQALQVLRMSGGWDMAEGLIEDVLSKHPARDRLWATAITALHKAGDTDAALQLFGRAPRTLATLVARAEIANDQGHFADAEQLALQALDRQNGALPAMRVFALASLGQEKWAQAQQISDLALRAHPNDQFFYAIKATAGRARGQDYGYYFNYDWVRSYDLDAPEGWADMAAFNADLKAELDALHGFSAAPLDQTLRLGTQTAPDLRFVDSPAIKAYFKAVAPALDDYVSRLPRQGGHVLLRRNTGAWRIRSAWSIRLGAGGHHVDHVHPEGWVSSAYYVDVPDLPGKQGWIKFGEPPIDIGQGPEHEVQPVAGRLVLFPSYLWHGTYPIEGDATRMTLPIDILPARPAQGPTS